MKDSENAFALWITGLPASGKTTLTTALVEKLARRGIHPAVLNSEQIRKFFAPRSVPAEEDRALFYQGIVEIAGMFLQRGVPVIIDAVGNRSTYRQAARNKFPRFAEVFVDCPPELCLERRSTASPSAYEAPLHSELHLRSDREEPGDGAQKVLDFLISSAWIPSRRFLPA